MPTEGLTGKAARREAWCEGLCKKHAGQKGMEDPKKKQKTKKTHMMKLKAKVKKASMKKKQRPATEIQKEQEPLEKRQKMWKLIRQPGPAIELPEDSEHSEVSKHEDGVVKKDTKKDKRLMEALQSPQKKQKDRAIDKRPVLVF